MPSPPPAPPAWPPLIGFSRYPSCRGAQGVPERLKHVRVVGQHPDWAAELAEEGGFQALAAAESDLLGHEVALLVEYWGFVAKLLGRGCVEDDPQEEETSVRL